ncbi:MAG: aminoglycoside phosphotransferase family protein [Spirochaetota bacterium]
MDSIEPLDRAREAAVQFTCLGDLVRVEAFGTGHINRTFVVSMDQGGTRLRYLLQLVNTFVFKNPYGLMDNVVRVTSHLRQRLAGEGVSDLSRRCLTVVPSLDGKPYHVDAEGGFWRCYIFIEGAVASELMDSEAKARSLGHAAGRFQYLLADLPGPRLVETIPSFHDARSRFEALERAAAGDAAGRLARAAPELDFWRARREGFDRIVVALERGLVPERITHNDTKIDNLLVDIRSGEGICVIDLDTVMPGSSAYDFGDLARTVSASTGEDDRQSERMELAMPMYQALVQGFASGTHASGEGRGGSFLTAGERELLPWGARILTMLMGVRFLTDFLEGDVYYRVAREGHNLDRTRTQMALIASMEGHWDGMRRAIDECF